MSADADHQVINKNMKTKKEVEDFEDWANIIASTCLSVHRMSEGDFVEAENLFRESKSRLLQGINARPYLRDFKVVQTAGTERIWAALHQEQLRPERLEDLQPREGQGGPEQAAEDAV